MMLIPQNLGYAYLTGVEVMFGLKLLAVVTHNPSDPGGSMRKQLGLESASMHYIADRHVCPWGKNDA